MKRTRLASVEQERKRQKSDTVDLPPEVWDQILSYLGWRELLRVAQLCTCFCELAHYWIQKRISFRAEMMYELFSSSSDGIVVFQYWHSILQWTRQEMMEDSCPALRFQEEAGNLAACQWLQSTFCLNWNKEEHRTEHHKDALAAALNEGHLDVCQWHCKTFRIEKPKLWEQECYLFRVALCSKNCSPLLRWLIHHYDIRKSDLVPIGSAFHRTDSMLDVILRSCSANGIWRGCEWLWYRFELTRRDTYGQWRTHLEQALLRGHVDFCAWFYRACQLEPLELAAALWPRSLGIIVRYGQLQSCKWLHALFKFTPEMVKGSRLLQEAAHSGNKELCEWLFSIFQPEDRYTAHSIFRVAASAGQLNICEWLCSLYSFTEEDAAYALCCALLDRQAETWVSIHKTFKPSRKKVWRAMHRFFSSWDIPRMKRDYYMYTIE